MRFWDKVWGRRAARREEHEREAKEDLEALERGEADDRGSHKRRIRDEYPEEGFPSAGAGYLPPP
ncbi:MAG TPA: hypothetical protein VHQ98_01730 [Gaiellaceae bacterium]|nr:hypothetical protein [Gaiellaceae bacterium]